MTIRGARWTSPGFFIGILLFNTVGLYVFTKGFLLSRRVLESSSICTSPLIPAQRQNESYHSEYAQDGCWMPRSFDKAVIVVIDALRYDFTIPSAPLSSGKDPYQPFHNVLTILHEKAAQEPQNAVLFPFIADPPTTTLQRVKGLTTGTLPTFIEAGANFAGSALLEDNVVTQLHKAGKRLVHLGDDTWTKLFPNHFLPNLSRAHDSLLIADLDTVDNDVEKHLLPLISSSQKEWDIIFAHLLGIDHVGHRFGPAHPEMTRKLKQMDRVIRDIINSLDENTLFIVMGDHGMDGHGNHGGETEDELQAALWMYARGKHFGHLPRYPEDPVSHTGKRPIRQIDLVPTLSLLLGVPIPFNNLGSPIEEAFIGPTGDNWRQLVHSQMLSFAQVERFHREYTAEMENTMHSFEYNNLDFPRNASWKEVVFRDNSSLKAASQQLRGYQMRILQHYKRIWTHFSILHMLEGLVMLSFVALALFLRICTPDQYSFFPGTYSEVIKMGAITASVICSSHVALTWPGEYCIVEGVILGTTIGSFMLLNCHFRLSGAAQITKNSQRLAFWDVLAMGSTILLSIGFASNSFTVWEDQIVLTFLATFGICALSASNRTFNKGKNTVGPLLCISFVALTRLVSLSRYCREEQLPFCVTTYHRLGSVMGWQLLIPSFITIIIPVASRLAFGPDLPRSMVLWIWCHIGMPMALLFNAVYWTLDSANRIGWFEDTNITIFSQVPRVVFSRLSLAIALAGSGMALTSKWTTSMTSIQCNMVITTSILMICILASGPMGGGSLSILYLQILSLRKLLNHSRNDTIGPTITALLGTLHFFGTGHNATFSSIQWEAAYILSQDIHYPWSPLLVLLNTFAGPIVAAFSTPLIISQDAHSRGTHVATKVLTVHVLVYTVWTLSTAVWASILRRHLMLFAIFCPRFLMAGILLLIVDIIAIITSLITAFNTNRLEAAIIETKRKANKQTNKQAGRVKDTSSKDSSRNAYPTMYLTC